jgi:hypothetical protein
MLQVVGTLATNELFAFNTVVPFISQIAVLPEVSRQAMSLLLSPLKSWVASGAVRPITILKDVMEGQHEGRGSNLEGTCAGCAAR